MLKSRPVSPVMRRMCSLLAAVVASILVAGILSAAPASAAARNAAPSAAPSVSRGLSLPSLFGDLDFGCATAKLAGQMRCLGKMRAYWLDGALAPLLTSGPKGLTPADLQSAYRLAGTHGGGRTVAIVDAMDDPHAESDLATYRKTFGLPACTTAGGCFKKINQQGATAPLPKGDPGWAEEISLDLDMVSAICPDCHILLTEASSPDTPNLTAAEAAAAKAPGVVAISNSWGGPEGRQTLAADATFTHPGIATTASSGDSGFGVIWPASSRLVTAVGGTSLRKAATARGWTETAWSGAGSGCSADEVKGAWQKDRSCARRTVADVSAVADPATGVAVFDTYNQCGTGRLCDFLIAAGVVQGLDGWGTVGGTSAASPIIAGVYALAGNTAQIRDSSFPYAHSSALFDVVSGANGRCGGTYLCTAGPGYDGPTGLGTPNGIGAF